MSAELISFDALLEETSVEEMRSDANSGGGCSSKSCGSSAGPGDMPADVWAKIKDHPCYSEEAHHYFARMHVAVAPACNIQCNYCNRKYDCANESRPGVVSEKLSPDQAFRKVVTVANEVPQLSVLGIAGPGDACYDWKKTKATFDLVSKAISDVKLCISTNGLTLPDHVDELADMNVDHVTITINMVDPAIGEKIYPWIYYNHKRYYGREASEILHRRQMEGLEMLTKRGILTKINSVMIPGINDEHLKIVNEEVKKRGAFLHNIMPLISDPAHGTHFGLTGQRGPTHAELKALQDACAGGANLMRHCRQCRADAVGLLGEDRGQEFTLDQLPDEVSYDPAKRDAYRQIVAKERNDHVAAKSQATAEIKSLAERPMLIAVATKGGGRINQHFGHAREFQIYEAGPEGVLFVGHRKVEDAYCQGGFGEDATLESVIKTLDGVDVVLCSKVGDCPKKDLAAAGLAVMDDFAFEYIEAAISEVFVRTNATRTALTA